jgi:hypothetical protein
VKGSDKSYEFTEKHSRPVPLKLADNKENYGQSPQGKLSNYKDTENPEI